jgi:Holliday junction resolvase
MSVKSRNKGSGFEREVAAILRDLTGVNFKRNLEQVRAADHGDLVPDDPAFPFIIECKRYAAGVSCLAAWKDQARRAAAATGKIPAVVFRFDRQPVRVAVPLSAICAPGSANEWAEISLPGLAYVAAEIMAQGAVDHV